MNPENSVQKQNWEHALEIARSARRCGAKTRRGTSCQCPAMPNGRCRIHGGKSPGAPRGEQHGMYKHGNYTHEAIGERQLLRELLVRSEATLKDMMEYQQRAI